MQIGRPHFAASRRIQNGYIGVAADRDRALPRIQPHDLGCVCRNQIDIAWKRVVTACNHLGVHHTEAGLDAGVAAGRVVDPVANGLVLERTAQLVSGDGVD